MEVTVKPYTIGQLAALFGISKTLMRKWLRPLQERIGKRNGHYYSVIQVRMIFDALGTPGCFASL